MVVFTCGECNESLKKNQVEKHYQTRCRNCNMLSCVDCGKDFWGEAYKEHIKCISEEEKYSGKNYKPKPNANKGEVKQEQWLQKVQTAIDNCKANFKLKGVLERMKDYPNIPRKKAKFENFVSNSMNVRDKKLVADAWQVLLENTETKVPESKEVQQENEDQNKMENVNGSVDQKEELKKLSKEERKAERKRVKNSVSDNDNLDKNDCNGVDSSEKPPKSKKAKKRKRQDSGAENDETDAKKQHTEETESNSNLNSSSTMNENDEEDSGGKVKFDWEDTISSILKSKGEISLKKLKKKVLCEYQAQGCKAKTEERLFAKLNKKITKNPRFIVKKEKVKLKNSK